MKQIPIAIWIGLVCVLLFGCGSDAKQVENVQMEPISTTTPVPAEEACYQNKPADQWCVRVTGVLDGNMIKGLIRQPGQPEYEGRIELLGVGETTDATMDYLRERIEGKIVWLSFDSKVTFSENYAIPAYVFYRKDEINLELVAKGLAKQSMEWELIDHEPAIIDAQQEAQRKQLGGWGDGTWK